MKAFYKILPWFFLGLFATEIVVVMLPKADGELHARDFGRLPVLLNGRIQPFDSVARNALLQIRSTGDVPLEEVPSWKFWHHPKKPSSTDWLLETFFKPEVADTRPTFLIHHPELISELKLGDKGVEKSGLRYYTFEELGPVLGEIGAQSRKAGEIEDAQRTTYQKQVLKLGNAVVLYQRLKNSLQPAETHNFAGLIAEYQAALPAGVAPASRAAGIDRIVPERRRFMLPSNAASLVLNDMNPSLGCQPPPNGSGKRLHETVGDGRRPAKHLETFSFLTRS